MKFPWCLKQVSRVCKQIFGFRGVWRCFKGVSGGFQGSSWVFLESFKRVSNKLLKCFEILKVLQKISKVF